MPDKNIFDSEKLALVDFKMIKGQVDTPADFDLGKVVGHQLDNELQLGFNLEDKLAKADFTINIQTDSKGVNKREATGNFHLLFIYRIENLEELATPAKNNKIDFPNYEQIDGGRFECNIVYNVKHGTGTEGSKTSGVCLGR